MRDPMGAERHTNRVLEPFHSIGGGVLLRCLIILFVIVPLLAPGARAGAYPADDEAPAFRIARVIEVTDGSKIYTQPVWSPDGTKLAFSTLPGFGGVYIRNADGSGPITEITSADYSGYEFVWAKDAYHPDDKPTFRDLRIERDERDSGIWIVFERDSTPGTEFPHRALLADLSPTGDRIAFLQGDGNIYVSNLDGSARVSLGRGAGDWDWSPDGRLIVYVGAEEDDGHATTASELFIANAETGLAAQLTATPDIVETFPRWSPD